MRSSEIVPAIAEAQFGHRPGYRADDRIATFSLVAQPFTVENGLLTQTMRVKRSQVGDRYRDLISSLFS